MFIKGVGRYEVRKYTYYYNYLFQNNIYFLGCYVKLKRVMKVYGLRKYNKLYNLRVWFSSVL